MPETATRARRRRSPEERRRQILASAVRLFSERGYGRTTTRDIARAAGISEGTIYTYFGSKQDLLFAFIEETVLRPLTSLMESLEHCRDEEVIRELLRTRFEAWQQNRALVKVVIGEGLFNPELAALLHGRVLRPVVQWVESLLRRGADEGRLRPLDVPVAARALIGNVVTFNLVWGTLFEAVEERLDPDRVIDTVVTLFFEGARRPPGTGGAPSGGAKGGGLER